MHRADQLGTVQQGTSGRVEASGGEREAQPGQGVRPVRIRGEFPPVALDGFEVIARGVRDISRGGAGDRRRSPVR